MTRDDDIWNENDRGLVIRTAPSRYRSPINMLSDVDNQTPGVWGPHTQAFTRAALDLFINWWRDFEYPEREEALNAVWGAAVSAIPDGLLHVPATAVTRDDVILMINARDFPVREVVYHQSRNMLFISWEDRPSMLAASNEQMLIRRGSPKLTSLPTTRRRLQFQ